MVQSCAGNANYLNQDPITDQTLTVPSIIVRRNSSKCVICVLLYCTVSREWVSPCVVLCSMRAGKSMSVSTCGCLCLDYVIHYMHVCMYERRRFKGKKQAEGWQEVKEGWGLREGWQGEGR